MYCNNYSTIIIVIITNQKHVHVKFNSESLRQYGQVINVQINVLLSANPTK